MAEEKEKTPEEIDEQLQKEAKEQSEKRAKFVDDLTDKIHAEIEKGLDQAGLQSILTQVQRRLAGTQVVAAGAEFGPSPAALEKLKETEFPILAKPMSDGTPVANIAQAPKKGDKPEEPKEFVPTPAGRSMPSASAPAHAHKK